MVFEDFAFASLSGTLDVGGWWVGVVGMGTRGRSDAEMVYVCDVFAPFVTGFCGGKVVVGSSDVRR
jgi:hypothetical protein